ncbi:MAG: nuclear transport factor 2 family protein [Quisquiliibacterium sp.]
MNIAPPPDSPTPWDLDQIRQLKSRYCRFVDLKHWEGLRELFTPGARFEGLGSAPTGASVDQFIEGISRRLGPCVSIHHCHTPDIVFLDANRARGIWAMMDYLQWPQPLQIREAQGEVVGFTGYGHYEEEYRRTDRGWRIALLRLTRIRIDAIRPGHPAPLPGIMAASDDWLGLNLPGERS